MSIKTIALQVMRAIGLFAGVRWMTRHRLRILCYHAGCDGDQDHFNPKLFCRSEHIERRLTWLRQAGFTPMSLDDAVAALRGHRPLPALPVVLTVDDGWASSRRDIIDVALSRGYPITLYVATEVLMAQVPVVDVTVRYVLWKAKVLSATVPDGDRWFPAGHFRLDNESDRRALADMAINTIKPFVRQSPESVAPALEHLAELVGVSSRDLDLASGRFAYLRPGELVEMANRGCAIELHGHIHHYPLADPGALFDDVKTCRSTLTSLGLPAARHYCFPSGEHDSHAPAVLQSLDVVSATTCKPGLASGGGGGAVESYFLPRFLDGRDVADIEFEAEMSGVLQIMRHLRFGRDPVTA